MAGFIVPSGCHVTSTPPTSSVVLVSGRVACQDLGVRLKIRPLPVGDSALNHVLSDHLSNPHGDLLTLVICERVSSVRVRGKMGLWCTIPTHSRYSTALYSHLVLESSFFWLHFLLEILGTGACSILQLLNRVRQLVGIALPRPSIEEDGCTEPGCCTKPKSDDASASHEHSTSTEHAHCVHPYCHRAVVEITHRGFSVPMNVELLE